MDPTHLSLKPQAVSEMKFQDIDLLLMSGTSAKLLLRNKAEGERQRRSNFEDIIPPSVVSARPHHRS